MTAETPADKDKPQAEKKPEAPKPEPQPKEHGGPNGAEPTRYNDWERGGRCVDF